MSNTFYIAAHSAPEVRERVRELAERLYKLNYIWYLDWTTTFIDGTHKPAIPPEEYPASAEADIEAAVNCEVFIFLVTEKRLGWSRGAHIEIGARLAAGKAVLVLSEDMEEGDYFFYYHPAITKFADEEFLLYHILRHKKCSCRISWSERIKKWLKLS